MKNSVTSIYELSYYLKPLSIYTTTPMYNSKIEVTL